MRSSQNGEDFLINQGSDNSFLETTGTEPSTNEQLTNLVIEGRRMSFYFLQGKLAKDPIKRILLESQ